MKSSCDVAVIGGGVIGHSVAYQLAKRKIDVAVFESEKIGQKATRAAAGMLGAHSEVEEEDLFFKFSVDSQKMFLPLQQELLSISGIDIQYNREGMLKLVFSEKKKADLIGKTNGRQGQTWLSPDEVKACEPEVTSKALGALFFPDDGHVSPIALNQAFSKGAAKLGAAIHEHSPVMNIAKDGENFLLHTPNGKVSCAKVVVANGPWSHYFFQQLGLPNQVFPVKGECLSLKTSEKWLTKTIFFDHCYLVPKNDGRIIVGATMIHDEWSHSPTASGIQWLLEKAKEILPKISKAEFDTAWAGLRPQTSDGKPYIGYHPEDENLVFATGHYRNGILLSPVTGTMVRDLVEKRSFTSEYTEEFSIDRCRKLEVS
ncbi:glycine oxidase ThiO [Metabacillus arenae]|uniref:glycine oxidase n=1 Tax=Metabacillus arenae TaxID=2771434 RepID=A0A926RXH5_9BACI|nr:glycine oxidase ThiO [Metabacillus arenae]MBD1381888.1 glycine oxidase ThiO [Metabacillus arenae]